MLKLGIHTDNDLFFVGLRIRLLALISPFICPFFCLFLFFFGYICVTAFSGTVRARIFKYGIRRMSDCIVGLRLRVMALIFLFLSSFLSFPILHLCWSFLRNFLKLEC